MKKINLIFGVLLFVSFLASGAYLKFIFRPEHLEDLVARMEIRANHIYILFISLLNILSFSVPATTGKMRRYDIVPRAMLLLAGLSSIAAFLWEHSGTLKVRTFTFYSVLLSLISVIGIWALSTFWKDKKESEL